MKKGQIYTLAALTVFGVAGVFYNLGKNIHVSTEINQKVTNENSNDIVEETENKDVEIDYNSKENESQKDLNENNTNNSISKFTYTISENDENGTLEIKSNDKVILNNLKHKIGETDKYLIYAKIGENNTANSEIVDWDIAFLNKNTGEATVFNDVQYTEIYVEYSSLCAVNNDIFYGVLDDTNSLFKIDLTKDELIKEAIKSAPKVKNIAGIYAKENLLFLVDEYDDIVSYDIKNGEFKHHKYYIGTTKETKSFTEIDSEDIFFKEFKFIENYTDEIYKNKDGLKMCINHYEESEQFNFFAYDKNTNDFYIYQ